MKKVIAFTKRSLDKKIPPIISVGLVFLLSVIVILVFWVLLPEAYQRDIGDDYYGHYRPVALNILAGRGVVRDDGVIATLTPPGYSLLLAGVFGISQWLNIPEASVVNMFLLIVVGLSSVFVYLIAGSIWGNGGLVAAFVWLSYPFMLWLTVEPNSENAFYLFLFAAFGLLWWLTRKPVHFWWVVFGLGLTLAAAMLVRPIAIGLPFVFVLLLWVFFRERPFRHRLGMACVILFAHILLIGPWTGWIYAQTGEVVILGAVGGNSSKLGWTFSATARDDFREKLALPADAQMVMDNLYDQYDELSSFSDLSRALFAEFTKRPWGVISLAAIKMARSWYATDSARYEDLILFVQCIYGVIILGSHYVAWKYYPASRWLMVFIWAIVLYFWGMTTMLAISILRYMVPILGLLFLPIAALPAWISSRETPAVTQKVPN